MRKSAFCICENKDANQLRSNCVADQRLCFRYTDSTIPLLSKSEFQASSHLLWLYSQVCVGPGQKTRKPLFSQRGSYIVNDKNDFLLLHLRPKMSLLHNRCSDVDGLLPLLLSI